MSPVCYYIAHGGSSVIVLCVCYIRWYCMLPVRVILLKLLH